MSRKTTNSLQFQRDVGELAKTTRSGETQKDTRRKIELSPLVPCVPSLACECFSSTILSLAGIITSPAKSSNFSRKLSYVIIVLYLTNRFHVAVRLFSNRSQMTSKCGKNRKVAHEAQDQGLLPITIAKSKWTID